MFSPSHHPVSHPVDLYHISSYGKKRGQISYPSFPPWVILIKDYYLGGWGDGFFSNLYDEVEIRGLNRSYNRSLIHLWGRSPRLYDRVLETSGLWPFLSVVQSLVMSLKDDLPTLRLSPRVGLRPILLHDVRWNLYILQVISVFSLGYGILLPVLLKIYMLNDLHLLCWSSRWVIIDQVGEVVGPRRVKM